MEKTKRTTSTLSVRFSEDEPRSKWMKIKNWFSKWWRALLCEFLCGFQMEVCTRFAKIPTNIEDLVLVRYISVITVGCTVFANVQSFGRISGGYGNPAVCLTSAVAGRISWVLAFAYTVSECAGSILGYAAVVQLIPPGDIELPTLCPNIFVQNNRSEVLLCEVGLTVFLAMFACSAWRPYGNEDAPAPAKHPIPPPDPLLSVKFGALLTGLSFCAEWLGGGSVNPARTLAASVWLSCWADHWLYWVGPCLGAVVGASLYRFILAPIPKGRKVEFVF